MIDQLRQYGETRRGWLGVRIQQVTDDIAESLSIKPPHGALVAGIDDKGPAKPGGIEPGDVVVKFDGHDIKEMHDLPRIVADTPVGKTVDVVVIRKGKEETHKVKIGRLEDGEKVARGGRQEGRRAGGQIRSCRRRWGSNFPACPTTCARSSRSGTISRACSSPASIRAWRRPHPDKRLAPGDVVVEVQYESVGTPADMQTRIDQLKSQSKKIAVLLVANANGETRFVALNLQ